MHLSFILRAHTNVSNCVETENLHLVFNMRQMFDKLCHYHVLRLLLLITITIHFLKNWKCVSYTSEFNSHYDRHGYHWVEPPVVVVAFSSHARMGKGLTIHSPPAFFMWRYACAHQFHSFIRRINPQWVSELRPPGASVPDELCVSSFPWWVPTEQ